MAGSRVWSSFGRGALAWCACASLASTGHALEVVGSSQATLQWTPAEGPVSGYYVIVSRDSAAAQVEGVTLATQETVEGSYGETLVIQVAAFGADGVAGPVSEPSDPITFVQASDPTDPPPADDPTDPPPADEEPAPGDGGSGSGTGPGRAVVRDFDADGLSDLIVRDGDALRLWSMQGARVAAELALPSAPAGADLVGTGDYDGNGSADLLWERPQSGELLLWLVNGGVVVGTPSIPLGLPAAEAWHVGGSADFDGDGGDDVMLFSRVAGAVEIWSFDGSSLAPGARLAGRSGAWSVSATDDSDGDGLAEIVWLDEFERVLEQQDPSTGDSLALGDLTAGWRGQGAADVDADGGSDLVMHHVETGALQSWQLSDAGVAAAADLPSASGLGSYAGSGDFDGDGREDLAWMDGATGAVTLLLDVVGAPHAAVVELALPAGGAVVSGSSGSDDGAFYERFCSADFDGDGDVDQADFGIFKQCFRKEADPASCEQTDLNSDGRLNMLDFGIFKARFQGVECDAP